MCVYVGLVFYATCFEIKYVEEKLKKLTQKENWYFLVVSDGSACVDSF